MFTNSTSHSLALNNSTLQMLYQQCLMCATSLKFNPQVNNHFNNHLQKLSSNKCQSYDTCTCKIMFIENYVPQSPTNSCNTHESSHQRQGVGQYMATWLHINISRSMVNLWNQSRMYMPQCLCSCKSMKVKAMYEVTSYCMKFTEVMWAHFLSLEVGIKMFQVAVEK